MKMPAYGFYAQVEKYQENERLEIEMMAVFNII